MEPNNETTITQNLHDTVKARMEMKGISWEDVKKGLTRIIPLIEMASRMTENPYDDLAVDFIKKLLDASN